MQLSCFADGFVGKIIGEAIWGCAIGAAVSGLIYLLSGFASTVIPYVAAAIVAFLGAYFYNKCLSINLKEQENDEILNPGFEHLELEPLHQAYHPQTNGFDSSIGDRSSAYQKELNDIKRTMWTKAVPVGIITVIGIIYFMFFYTGVRSYHSDSNSAFVSQKVSTAPDFSNGLYGTWVGKIQGNRISIVFQKTASPKEFTFILNGLGNSTEKLKISGTFNPAINELKITKFSAVIETNLDTGIKASGTLNLDNDLIYGDVRFINSRNGDVELSIPINVQYEPK